MLLLFPIGIQASHILNKHEHEICREAESHIHQTPLECNICDFHFSFFRYKPTPLPIIIDEVKIEKNSCFLFIVTSKDFSTHFYLRGPPLFS